MEKTFIGARYEYLYGEKLITELHKRKYHFIVKWKNHNPDGIEWLKRNGKVPTRREIREQIAEIIGINIKDLYHYSINMGVRETIDGDAYEQFVIGVTIVVTKEIT